MLDAEVYDRWAREIAAGQWIGGPVFYHAPLYPYLLAVLFRLAGHAFLPVYVGQLLLGVGVLALAHQVGRRCAGPAVGLGAALLLLLYAPLPFFETKLMSTSVALFLSVTALAVLTRAWDGRGVGAWAGGGALIGLAALAHPASLLLAPVFAVALFLRTRRLPEAAALLGGTLLAIAPATAHNFLAGGGLVPISSQGGITFYQGNTPSSRGLYQAAEGFSGSPLTQRDEEKQLAEKALGRPLKASEISGYWFGRGWEGIRQSPAAYLELLQLKLIRWFSSVEYSTEYSLSGERETILSLRLPFLPFGFLAVGGLVGLLMAWRTYPRLAPVALYLFATWLPPMIFYVSSRYRIAAVPALAILSAVALERIAEKARAGSWMDAAPPAAAILLLGAMTLVPYGRDHLFQDANVHYNTGNLYYDLQDYDRAIEEYGRALQVSDMEFYRVNLGNALARKGRLDEAIEQYRLVVARKPGFAKAHVQWAKALLQQGKMEEAREEYRKAVALGMRNTDLEAKFREGSGGAPPADLETARQAAAANPNDVTLRNNLGIALQESGDLAGAEREYRAANSLDPRYEKSRYNLGLLLERQNRPDEALTEYEEAARIHPDYARAELRAGMLRARRGDVEEARRWFEAVLKADPANAQAQEELKKLPGKR